ncbi:small nuclear ribonucleoprotein family protein [Wolffia australiana]
MESTSKSQQPVDMLPAPEDLSQRNVDFPAQPNDADGVDSAAVQKLRSLLFRRMLVGVNDGRFFAGAFHCLDKQGNIILQDAVEFRSLRRGCHSPMEQRSLGLILIPASCRISCHVDCSIEEQISLLSL